MPWVAIFQRCRWFSLGHGARETWRQGLTKTSAIRELMRNSLSNEHLWTMKCVVFFRIGDVCACREENTLCSCSITWVERRGDRRSRQMCHCCEGLRDNLELSPEFEDVQMSDLERNRKSLQALDVPGWMCIPVRPNDYLSGACPYKKGLD